MPSGFFNTLESKYYLKIGVVSKLVAAIIDSLMFFSKGPLRASEARGPDFTGKEKNIVESTHATNFGTNPKNLFE